MKNLLLFSIAMILCFGMSQIATASAKTNSSAKANYRSVPTEQLIELLALKQIHLGNSSKIDLEKAFKYGESFYGSFARCRAMIQEDNENLSRQITAISQEIEQRKARQAEAQESQPRTE